MIENACLKVWERKAVDPKEITITHASLPRQKYQMTEQR
jgi:hypothetical protein